MPAKPSQHSKPAPDSPVALRQTVARLERELQLEAALERVRAASLAMHQTNELQTVVNTLFEQVKSLHIPLNSASIFILEEGKKDWQQWVATDTTSYSAYFHLPYGNFKVQRDFQHARDEGLDFYTAKYNRQQKNSWFTHAFAKTEYRRVPKERQEYMLGSDRLLFSVALQPHIALQLAKYEGDPFSEAENQTLVRFAKVFEQAYVRFLDLQKAEAQAREAEVQLALERVRAATMAMHTSRELSEVAAVLFGQMRELGVTPERLNIGIVQESDGIIEYWSTEQGGKQIDRLFKGAIDEPTTISKLYAGWKASQPILELHQSGVELTQWLRHLKEVLGMPFDESLRQQRRVQTAANFKHGMLLVSTPDPVSEESKTLLHRFAGVFEQTYTRFLDLQMAEKQAREAQIEAALERVRARTMAMHNTDDIAATVTTFFNELLGLDPDASLRCGVGILSQGEQMQLWTASVQDNSQTVLHSGTLDMSLHPMLIGAAENWARRGTAFSYTLEGTDLKRYFQIVNDAPHYPVRFNLEALPKTVYHNSFTFRDGILFVFTQAPLPGDIRVILERFAGVFGQTYTRYLDLQKAEERAREAIKQASIERVRGEIASMRSADDLSRITPLVWNELTTLGVPFFRCGVFIVDEKQRQIHSFLSNPKGESLAAWHVGFGLIAVFDDMVKSWQKQEVFTTEWDRQGFLDFSKTLMDHGLVDNRERYQSGADAPEHLVLHMVPFAQGMLYVGSQVHLNPSHMELVQALAAAFSVAYARYDDFRQLEKTLAELKATQAQLIQSEKMASLGELTAGIAHEIKNPLNFVNNFSEVSRELLDELVAELEKGDLEEVRALVRDVSDNLEKIAHHGSRADSIVKGMLQHSRSGDGKKEPTDLNALADEYLRLAYHGLRAKDKSFNATLNTDFDPSVGTVDIIPQDLGRVILNLLTNAFYAVGEKARNAREGYVPTVAVKTTRHNGQVQIAVSDNGNGMPPHVREKIFQPFYTTKPTGQGTGLGLSMSYDIVTKGHGGTISVESAEGKGTEFVINLTGS